MPKKLITTQSNTLYLCGYYLVHAIYQDVIAQPVLKHIYHVLCLFGTMPTTISPFTPNTNIKVQTIEFTNCNDKFPTKPQIQKKNLPSSTQFYTN